MTDLVDLLMTRLADLGLPGPSSTASTPGMPRRGFIPGGSWILDPPAGIPAVWGEGEDVLWAEGEPMFIAGGAGVGKSTLAAQLVMARVGLRSDLLGYPVTASDRPVLYLASDRPRQMQRVFRRLADPGDRAHLDEHLTVWPGPPEVDLAKDPELLLRMCIETGCGTVFLDSLKDMAIGLTEDAIAASLNRAIQLVIAAGIEVAVLHHLTKAGAEEGPSLHKVYGSAWIVNGAGSVFTLQGSAGATVVQMHHVKQPAAVVGPLTVEHDHLSGVSRVVGSVDFVAIAVGSSTGVTAREAAEQALGTDNPTEAQIKKAKRHLDAAVRSGKLDADKGTSGGSGGSKATTYRASAAP